MVYFYRVNLSQYYTYYSTIQNYILRSRLNTNGHRPPRSTLKPALYIDVRIRQSRFANDPRGSGNRDSTVNETQVRTTRRR